MYRLPYKCLYTEYPTVSSVAIRNEIMYAVCSKHNHFLLFTALVVVGT